MIPTLANGQPAAIAYYRGGAFGLGVLTVTRAGISRITVFGGGPDLAARFGNAGAGYATPPAGSTSTNVGLGTATTAAGRRST